MSVRLLYLKDPVVIDSDPSEQALRGLKQRTSAVWSAIERACEDEDFRPKPSGLCKWCHFQEFCPAFGGDPARASALAQELAERPRELAGVDAVPA